MGTLPSYFRLLCSGNGEARGPGKGLQPGRGRGYGEVRNGERGRGLGPTENHVFSALLSSMATVKTV